MAFDDHPKITKPFLNSDDSVKALTGILTPVAGFILRPDVPDFGCDFDAELISEKENVTNSRFPIQLKSVENISFVQNGKYISYAFKTSRLGYLIKRIPAFGIIVIYDVQSKISYYEYADEIYVRLMDERDSADWKTNEFVNILIPAGNVLNQTAAEELHKIFTYRFAQGALMQASHGAKYGIPAINIKPKSGYDFNNIEDIKKALKEKGMALLIHFDLQIVYSLLLEVPVAQIISNKELCLVALIAYAEAGKFADSMYFTERFRKRFDITVDEKATVDFVELKNQLSLGKINPAEYIEKAQQLLPTLSGTNLIVLKINILFFRLAQVRALEAMPMDLGDETQKLFFEIEDTEMDEVQKQYLKIWNGENMLVWIAHFRNEGFAEMALREAMGSPLPLQDRREKAETLIKVHGMFYGFLSTIDKKAKEWGNDLLRAHLFNLVLRFQLTFEISKITNNMPIGDHGGEEISNKLEYGVAAFNAFLENNHFYQAFLSLLYQLDLIYVSRDRYGLKDRFDLNALLKIKSDMEREFEFNGELSIPSALRKRSEMNRETGTSMAFLVGLTETQLDTLAEIVGQTKKFPNAKKEHIINELKSYQVFHERCNNPDITVEQALMSQLVMYSQPVSFILKNNKINLITPPNADMDKLLKSWGY